MNTTIILTVFSGVLIYIIGQLFLKLLIEPIQHMKATIGEISHAFIEHGNVIANPGVPKEEKITEASEQLRKLSSKIQSHLYLVPFYSFSSSLFRLPSQQDVLTSSKYLIGLSNSMHKTTNEKVYESNARRVEIICDCLGIYISDDERYPKD